MSITAKDILIRARERISKPGGWSQGAYGRDADGGVCPTKDAVSCCLVGSVVAESRFIEDDSVAALAETLLYVGRPAGSPGAAEWNDAPGRTQGEVVDYLDSVISNYDALVAKLEPKK